MRFANRLEFGDKTHEVSMTAQRLVQRMKKDSIHSGRRPSGLCGAALLLAARMHDFNRKPNDIVRVVKIHESTLRKRLLEFGETPSSALTIDEFMTIDLEAEHDPPAFKAARKKDKERLQKLADENEFTSLQIEIDAALERDLKKNRKRKLTINGSALPIEDFDENTETDKFIGESTFDVINKCMLNEDEQEEASTAEISNEEEDSELTGLKPDLLALCTVSEKEQVLLSSSKNEAEKSCNLDLEGLDDDEINGYILTESEAVLKDRLWNQMNAEYLKIAKEREEKAAREREEGKPEKKKRKSRKKPIGPSSSAGEAIEKMLQEKKISSKINYDILKSLTTPPENEEESVNAPIEEVTEIVCDKVPKIEGSRKIYVNLSNNRRSKTQIGLPIVMQSEQAEEKPVVENADDDDEDDLLDADDQIEQEQQRDDRLGDILNVAEEEYGNEDYY